MLKSEDLPALREKARTLNLDGWQLLRDTPDEVVMQVCNGIGPACFPPVIREALDALHPSLVIVSVIHDLEWEFASGSFDEFLATNEHFRANGRKVADAAYRWWDIRRYIVRRDADRLANLCDCFGWLAYRASIRSREVASK